jgi:hypothetical protein
MIANTATLTGRLCMRVWASVNQDSTSARELTSGAVFSNVLGISTSGTTLTTSWSAPAITLNNEYLFFQLEWQEQTSTGSSVSDNALFRQGSSIVSASAAVVANISANLAGAGALTADATILTVALGTPTGPSGSSVWYKFEDSTTTDSSGNNNTGTLGGSPLPVLGTGKFGQGMVFGGPSGGIAVPSAAVSVPTATSSFSVMAWVKTSFNGDGQPIFGGRTGSSTSIIDFMLGYNGVDNAGTNTASILVWADDGSGQTHINGTTALNDNAWHHVCVVFDGSGGAALSDNFNRANGSLGSPWINSPSLTGLAIASNQVTMGSAAWALAYWDPAVNAAPADQWASVVCSAGTFMGPVVRHQSGASSGYMCFYNGNASGLIYLYSFTGGTFNFLSNAVGSCNIGDTLTLQAVGSTLRVLVNGVSTGTFTDTTYSSGQPGIAAQQGTLDNFSAGTTQTLKLYVDGTQQGSTTTAPLTSGITLNNAYVGRENAQGWGITGTIDDFRFYPKALTVTEIGTLLVGVAGATTWQGSATPAGTGALTVNANLLAQAAAVLAGVGAQTASAWLYMPASLAPLAGVSALTTTLRQSLPFAASPFSGVGAFAPLNLSPQLVSSASFSGAGQASWPTINPINQLLVARATLAGASSESSALNVLLGTTSALSGAGQANWPTTNPVNQLLVASSLLAGGSALVGDVTRVVGAGTQWQGTALWAGASTLAAQATAILVASSSLAGSAALTVQVGVGLATTAALSGASSQSSALSVLLRTTSALSGVGAASWPTIDPIDQLLAATATLAGASTSASSLLTLRPVTATLAGASAQLASMTARMPSVAALAGAATLAGSLSQTLLSSAIWAGAGAALSGLTQQLSVNVASFAAVGNLTGDAPVLRAAYATFAGSSALTVAPAQWLTSTAAFAGAGSLIATPVQWQGIAALAPGASTLNGDLFIPGHNAWSAILNVWPATGTLIAATTAQLAAVSNLAAASTLAGSLTTRMPISAVATGAGQLSATAAQAVAAKSTLAGAGQSAATSSSLQLAANASVSGVGGLTGNYYQLLSITSSVLNGLGGLVTTPAQWMQTTSALNGVGALAGDIVKLTGGQLRPIDAVVYLGTSALTAQTAQWLQGLVTWSGAGALTPPSVSVIEPVTLSLGGQSSMAASAALRMSAVFAAAGVGQVAADLVRFTPGIQQGSALLTGASLLVAATSQSMAVNLALAGNGTLTGLGSLRMAASSLWAGSSVLTADLGRLGQATQIATALAGVGGFSAVASLALPLKASFGAAGTLIAVAQQLAALAPQPLQGAGAINARATNLMALQTLLGGASSLTAAPTQFQQVAGILAAAGYSAAYLGQIQLLSQQILFGTGVLGANLIQTSIRVVTATIIGRPSESGINVTGRNPNTSTVTGQDERAGISVTGRKSATTVTGQNPRTGIIGQGDFVTLH